MNERKMVLTTMRRTLTAMRGWRALVGLGVLALVLASAAVSANQVLAAHGDVEVWPAYYEGGVVSVLMYPIGHKKANPHFGSSCFSKSPAVAKGESLKELPKFYALFVPGATQMYCQGGAFMHDMVVTAVPGDPGYNPKVQLIRCFPGVNFGDSPMPYDSEAKVDAGILADELDCLEPIVVLSPVVLGPP